MDKYEVWHKKSGELFPDNYVLAAVVFADSLEAVVDKTQDKVSMDGEIEPWSLCSLPVDSVPYAVLFARDTRAGDIIVDATGNAHRYDGESFAMTRPAPEKSDYEKAIDAAAEMAKYRTKDREHEGPDR